jgi:putative lipoic acid-binding regulatory protein
MPDKGDGALQFPCTFPIKAMGKADEGFRELVVEIVRRHAPDLDESGVRARASRGGKWVSITVTIEATGRDQLDAIYRELSAHESVVLAI